MIVDLILDRRAGDEYDPRRFYSEVSEYGDVLILVLLELSL